MRRKEARSGTPYLDWQPLLDPQRIYDRPPAPQYPQWHDGRLYFIEQRASEGGRNVLVCLEEDGSPVCLTPEGYNIRSRVHEYGGKAHLLHNGQVYFSNDADGAIYRQVLTPDTTPQRLLHTEQAPGMSIDFQITPDGRFLVFVHERQREGAENENRLCWLRLDDPDGRIHDLVSGADFYAAPVISRDGGRIAWLQWDHPLMPWDGTDLMTAPLVVRDGRLTIDAGGIERVAGGSECAVCQPHYAQDGRLLFALDGVDERRGVTADSWDLFSWYDGGLSRLTSDRTEYGEALWIFGQQRIASLPDGRIIAIATDDGIDRLVLISPDDSGITTLSAPEDTSISQLSLDDDACIYLAASFRQDVAVWRAEAGAPAPQRLYGMDQPLEAADISVPTHLNYPTRDGGSAHALYYPPCNSHYRPLADDRPPLLVMVHGGPTHRCEAALNLQRQYWTSRGFAILDVDHRGSTGYGRAYRQALRGQWGVLETADVADGVNHAIAEGLAHPDRVCIRGGSAGGYEVLRALTLYPDLFCAGACYYGIGNLVTLMEITHKFEAHYLDGLLGAPFEGDASDRPGSPYYDRSPIHHLDVLKSPMIVFQGLDDKVVPPAVSREIVRALEEKGIRHQYVEYEGEGHGFRRKETRIDALEKEAAFFMDVIRGVE